MRRPRRFITRMVLFLGAVAIVVALLYPTIEKAFRANMVLNGLIVVVLFIGIIYTVRQVLLLDGEVGWLITYRGSTADSANKEPRLLAPMASMLRERKGKMSLSALSTRSILDSIGSRLDESREISRYLISLLIFLGLLGTFWGLLNTIGSISGTINGLSVTSNDITVMFNELKSGLSAPLSGMGTAFSSSLFGLAGSVILGFIDLQAGQAQNRFYNDLEEWLSSVTRLSSGGVAIEGEGGGAAPAYLIALQEQTAEAISELQRIFERSEQNRASVNATLVQLAEKLGGLTDHLKGDRGALKEALGELRPQGDEITREHLSNIDVQLGRLIKEVEASREQMSRDLRSEIKLLARTIGAGQPAESPASAPAAPPSSVLGEKPERMPWPITDRDEKPDTDPGERE